MVSKIWRFFLLNKRYLFSLPRSLYYNFRLLPFYQAIRIPIFLSNYVKVKINHKSQVKIENRNIHAGMIKIGYTQCGFFPANHHNSILDIGEGVLVFEGYASIGSGAKLSVDKGGLLFIGNQFWSTGPILIVARKLIRFGYNCVLSWNISIMDHDAHDIYHCGALSNTPHSVMIGNHCWIGFNSIILKDSSLSNDVIVGANSIVTKGIEESNVIIAGNPATIKKRNVIWGN